MGLVEGFAGVNYLLGDLVATIAFLCSVWIFGAAFINLGSDMPVDAPLKTYLAWMSAMLFTIFGQISIAGVGLSQTVSGILGLSPKYPMMTALFSVGIFILSRLLRKEKYARVL
jgi:hypothetical protein